MKKKSLVLAAALILSIIPAHAKAAGREIFVDPLAKNGDGTIESPYSTLDEARDAVRKIKKNGYPEGGITVFLRGGNYNLNDTFKLSKEDGGTNEAPVYWRAYNNEKVNISGGATLYLNDFQLATDSAIDENAKGKVYSCNLKQKGINGYDMLHITGHAQHYLLQFGLLTDGDTQDFGTANPEIVFDGNMIGTLARYPNDGYMTISKVVDAGDNPARWGESEDSYMYVPLENRHYPPIPPTVAIEDERISRWTNAKHAWVKGYWFYDWSDQSMRVDTVNAEKGTIKMKDPSGYSAKAGQRFFIYNLLEELDSPGEWYYDQDTGVMYVYPPNNNPETEILLAFATNNVIEVDKAENIVFKDLKISGTRASGIVCNGCDNVDVMYCEISNTAGDSGISYDNSYNCDVVGCHVYDVGAKCVTMHGGDRQTLKPGNNTIENCWLHNFGRLLKTYAGGIKMTGVGNAARYNLIYDGAHLGVNLGGNDHIVEYNDIHSVIKEADDMGAIYAGRNMTARGNVIRNNYIHDLKSDSAQTAGKWAIYLDDQQCGYEIIDNIITNATEGIFINGGRDNTMVNNIFANLQNQSICISDQGRAYYTNNGIFNEEYLGCAGIPYTGEAYSKYPHMNNLKEDEPLTPKYNVVKNNLSYNVPSEINISLHPTAFSTMTSAEMKEKNEIVQGMSVTQNPGFKSVEKGNLELESTSKVFEKLPEFHNISMDKIGLTTSRLKEVLSDNSLVLMSNSQKIFKNWEKGIIPDEIQVPFEENEKTYIPLRFVSESFGAEVGFEDGTITVNISGSEIKIKPDSKMCELDGASYELSTEVISRNDRTYILAEDFAELTFKKVIVNDGIIVIADEDKINKFDDEMINDLVRRMK